MGRLEQLVELMGERTGAEGQKPLGRTKLLEGVKIEVIYGEEIPIEPLSVSEATLVPLEKPATWGRVC